MKEPHSTKALISAEAEDVRAISVRQIIGSTISTRASINAYFKGEITIQELNARGIKFVHTI
nr:hypothetical protein [uncultured Dyadobacter sp.]